MLDNFFIYSFQKLILFDLENSLFIKGKLTSNEKKNLLER